MKLKKVLEKLEKLFGGWGLNLDDWILIANYANWLDGYRVKLRKGHFNTFININKLPWKARKEGFEISPPKKSKELKEYEKWMKETGFDTGLVPQTQRELRKVIESGDTFIYVLPNGQKIRVMNFIGNLKCFDEHLAYAAKYGGRKRMKRLLGDLKSQMKVAEERGDKIGRKYCQKILRKYKEFLEEEKPIKELNIFRKNGYLKGQVSYKGRNKKLRGKVKIILNEKGLKKIKKGEIVACEMTTPKFSPFLLRIKAILTNDGGILCHAAILAREFKIPCVIGTKIATKVLKDRDLVEIDAEKGVVKVLKRVK